MPYVLERLDYTWERSRYEGVTAPTARPRFSRSTSGCAWSPTATPSINRHLIGLDKLMWECDFPHNDSNLPDSRKVLEDAVADVPDDEAHQIGELNARNFYDFW